MTDNYIPLRVNREFGDIITTYFDFFKQNIKKFTNVFLSYNGIFLVGLLVASYLLVSGFIGLIAYETGYNDFGSSGDIEEKYTIFLIAGSILFFIIFIIVMVLNFALASSYMITYENHQNNNFDKKEVWEYTKNQFGNIIVFILLMIPIYIGFAIVSLIFAFIPIVGLFVQYILQYFIKSWLGVSFYDMMQNKKGVTDGLGEGWKLVSKNFWKSVGVNFILGLLIGILMIIALIIPGVIIGVYTFHVVENNVDYSTSIVSTIIYTLGTCLVLVLAVYGQCLLQFVNGILYYSLHEKTYNVNTRSRIDEIGKSE